MQERNQFKYVNIVKVNIAGTTEDCYTASVSGVPSGCARYSVNTLGYQKNIFVKKPFPLKPKI